MRVAVLFECSGTVRDAFIAAGHKAVSFDMKPSEKPGPHYEGDVFETSDFRTGFRTFHMVIAHPPCTYLSVSGLHWNKRVSGRAEKTEEALALVSKVLALPVPRLAVENPIGCIGTRIRKADQIIQPYQFGDDASKATCLWLKGLPNLVPTKHVPPRLVNGKSRWANQTDSGQNKLGPSPDRAAIRAKTYQGIADAMAAQRGNLDQLETIQ